MKTLSKEQQQKYVENGGYSCPFCGCENIEGSSFNYEAGMVWQRVSCTECDAEWQDVYTLTSVEQVSGEPWP